MTRAESAARHRRAQALGQYHPLWEASWDPGTGCPLACGSLTYRFREDAKRVSVAPVPHSLTRGGEGWGRGNGVVAAEGAMDGKKARGGQVLQEASEAIEDHT
jgi:hypothetical protein